MKKLESSGWRRGGKQNWLRRGKWSFILDMSWYGPFSALAVGISIGRSDAVSSLGSTKRSSRISCISGLWYPAGMNKTKQLRVDTRTQLLRSGGRWRNSWSAWRSSRWTIESRTSFRLLRDRAHRNRCRLREPGSCLRNSSGIHRIAARWAAATHCFVDPGCCMGRKMRRNRGDLCHSTQLHGRIRIPRYWGCMPRLEGRAAQRYTKLALC